MRVMYLRVRAEESVFRWVQPMTLVAALIVWVFVFVLTMVDRQAWPWQLVEVIDGTWASYSVRMILFPLTVLALALLEHRVRIYSKGLSILGDVSYSSYLWHFPLQLLFVVVAGVMSIDRSAFYAPQALLIFFGILIPLSYASYHWLEMPLQKALRKWGL